ncbi:small acid-soluble spore protein H (minor) [Geomicrobium halophilum]|uniref:Small acid-soluble spore protein H (Minor) n=1 Tax=Geomicrobium halophilum TaxID=549000 RepID=A0A841PW68_9BACL|nr:small acid-soluble spore protein H [Geomicrobium halophilum]MBB6448523.1 small acid-soluble spore protein H (minor) [Geomicrobium halophilum]
MDEQRAQAIANSPDMKHVTYEGTPIYIQHVDTENSTARIYPLDQPEQEQSVSVDSLEEH